MSEEKRERLKFKEQRKNPGAALNNAWAQAMTGAPGSGCLVNVISVLIVVGVVLLIRACSQ
ncbi:hypothetical protein DYI25_18220 [Mesobacillus boroniphilus]|uniref:Uncharacterized protein n=1 Tax=Mesobacillus boroniphilus TaxID=308892 RepID=A0A944GXZ3_9BACI|nr:hypothetical protein [Mesobacillus boroniphilus]MBS8266362.1 hypothetical protein [Mesobacillus boroniphilus]